MKQRFKFGAWLCVLVLGGALLAPCAGAQNRPSADRPPANQPRPSSQAPRSDRPPGNYHPQNSTRGGNANPQPAHADRPRTSQDRAGNRNAGGNRPGGQNNGQNNGRNNSRDYRPPNQARQQTPAMPPPNVQERLRNMTPQEKSRLAENQRKFRQLPPQKQQEMRQAAEQWRKLTPEQQNHIKNDVMPKWQQMSPQRQKAISNRLAVLQNMPESARNRHLSDPNFTRGMSDDDRQMLRDLSHEHVGAPDPPQEQ